MGALGGELVGRVAITRSEMKTMSAIQMVTALVLGGS